MKRTKAAGILAVAASLSLVLAGCASTSTSSEAPAATESAAAPAEAAPSEAAPTAAAECTEPIIIGSAMAQTGFMSPFDVPALDTARIAIDKANAEGGVLGCQLELVAVDGETNPDKGAQIATDLISQGAKMLLVTCDYDINAKASQVAQDAGVLVIAPCVGDTMLPCSRTCQSSTPKISARCSKSVGPNLVAKSLPHLSSAKHQKAHLHLR